MGHRDSCDDLREVRWGVLGAGHISHRFASSLKEVDGARLVAAAGRTPSHVEGFCRAFSIDAAHSYATADGSGDAAYDALIADPRCRRNLLGSSAWHAYALGLSRAARRKGRAVRKAGRFE
mgnify:CR=1 FL=1